MINLAARAMPSAATVQVGIVTGVAVEADLFGTSPFVGCSAANAARARSLAQDMVDRGATHLLSFGLAGALDPSLRPGDLVVASHVATSLAAWNADAAWIADFSVEHPRAHVGGIWGSDTLISGAAAKRLIHAASRCLAVDMESHAVAEVAHQARLPFLAVRAICDDARMSLPPAALLDLTPQGKPDLRAIFRAIGQNPAQLPSLIRLARAQKKALETLTALVGRGDISEDRAQA